MPSAVPAQNDMAEHWRSRYYTELAGLETEIAQLRDVESLLRRLGSRFCIALRGSYAHVDTVLTSLVPALREPAEAPVLRALLADFTAAVERLDREDTSPKPEPQEDRADLPRWPAVLVELLGRLRFSEASREQADNLLTRLRAMDATTPDPAEFLGVAADLVNRQQAELHASLMRFHSAFQQISKRLDAVFAHVAADAQAYQDARVSGESLEQQVRGEVVHIGTSVREAQDLESLQHQVDERLQKIDQHMGAYRDRERELASAYRERSEGMRYRIAELEQQAMSLEAAMQVQKKQAYIDPLTGIPNRLAWERQSSAYIKRLERHGHPLCLAIWDVDHFKAVNDTYGHKAGDKALRLVARRLAGCVRETDFVARVGGEEFVMLLEDLDMEAALPLLQQWREDVAAAPFRHAEQPVDLTVSCGYTQVQAGESIDEAFERADQALYAAKHAGRNCIKQA